MLARSRSRRSQPAREALHLTGRVSLADGATVRASISVVRARRDSAVGLLPIDVGGWEAQVGSDGRFDLELPKLGKDEGFMVWAAAEGHLLSCEVFLLPGGVELEFILVPKCNAGN